MAQEPNTTEPDFNSQIDAILRDMDSQMAEDDHNARIDAILRDVFCLD